MEDPLKVELVVLALKTTAATLFPTPFRFAAADEECGSPKVAAATAWEEEAFPKKAAAAGGGEEKKQLLSLNSWYSEEAAVVAAPLMRLVRPPT